MDDKRDRDERDRGMTAVFSAMQVPPALPISQSNATAPSTLVVRRREEYLLQAVTGLQPSRRPYVRQS